MLNGLEDRVMRYPHAVLEDSMKFKKIIPMLSITIYGEYSPRARP